MKGPIATNDPNVICHPGYSASQRLWERAGPDAYYEMQDRVFALYGFARVPHEAFTLDDRVSLSIGGKQKASSALSSASSLLAEAVPCR